MTEKKIDTWRDKMVAALYGELSPVEQGELEAAIEADESLQNDWQELNEARTWLAEAGREGEQPGSIFEMPVAHSSALQVAEVVPMRRWMPAAAAGFAAAATVFFALLLFGLRVDRTPSGVLVSFGEAAVAEQVAAAQPEAGKAAMASDLGQEYLTRAELAFHTQELLDFTSARLDELERRQNGAQAELTQALYGALADRQQRHYDDLRTHIELAAYRTAQAVPRMVPMPDQRPTTPKMEDQENDTY